MPSTHGTPPVSFRDLCAGAGKRSLQTGAIQLHAVGDVATQIIDQSDHSLLGLAVVSGDRQGAAARCPRRSAVRLNVAFQALTIFAPANWYWTISLVVVAPCPALAPARRGRDRTCRHP